jgi:hypothetical protein
MSLRLSYLKSIIEGELGLTYMRDLSGEAADVSIISTSGALFTFTSSLSSTIEVSSSSYYDFYFLSSSLNLLFS